MSPSLDVVDSVLAVNVAIYKSAEEGGGFRKYFAQFEIKPKKQTIKPTFSTRKKRSTMLYESNMYIQNQAKWEAAKKWSKKKGYKFLILTEDDLFCNK